VFFLFIVCVIVDLIAVKEPPFGLKMNPRSMYGNQLLKKFFSVYFVNEIGQKKIRTFNVNEIMK